MAGVPSLQPSPVPPSTQISPSAQPAPRGRRRGGNRGENRRRGGARVRGENNSASATGRDASAVLDRRNTESGESRPTESERTAPPPPSAPDRGGRGGRGRGRGARRAGPGERSAAIQAGRVETVSGRKFGGQLTRNQGETSAQPAAQEPGQEGQLRADAPAFVPGQPLSSRTQNSSPPSLPAGPTKSKGKQPQRQPQAQAKSKSTADDMASRIHEDIVNGLYECPICTSELGRRSKIWSCDRCWTVFHLSCIKKWSKNEGSAFARPRELPQPEEHDGVAGSSSSSRLWRCPGCNLPHDILPTSYTCWCEKEVDPRPLPGLPPHSCGQTCSKSRKGCPHPCDLVCHAGPCPPCKAMGPTQYCFCGRHESTKRCVDTDYERGWSCGEICGEMMPCLEHTCPRPCHEGLCGECVERVDVRCYCGKVEKKLRCREKGEEWSSTNEIETWLGSFACEATCGRPFDCGVHTCQKACHPQDRDVPHCPFSPDVVTHCPCGKTPLVEIPGVRDHPRTSCQDVIPNCTKPCEKILPCGHPCPTVCHTGPCPPCFLRVELKCRCGRSTFHSMCQQGMDEPPMCFRVCGTSMSCGRHTCQERCCPGGRKSLERQATRRKLKSMNISVSARNDDIEAEHICTRVCNKPLKCGKHACPELCHKGTCNTCREAIFDEISCSCGRTVLYPPLPCGTGPPACHFPCERTKQCGHPQTPHNCHTDAESCPKCPYLTEKLCLCGKKTLKNQPCWLVDGRCGLVCGRLLKCGAHTCTKTCHRPGDCEDATVDCQQPCGKTKKLCGHPCTDVCHAPFPCQEKTPCETMVTITCACGRLKQEKRCNASRDRSRPPAAKANPLKCDDECARLQRNRCVASALNVAIDPETTVSMANPQDTSSTLPYSDETLDLYVQLSSSATLQTLQSYESALHALAHSETQRSVRFQPAKKQLRAFAHSLAADWGFLSESFDPDPHRHVLVFKTGGWTPPSLALAGTGIGIRGVSVGECVKLRERERAKEREAKKALAAEKARLAAENTAANSPGAAQAGDGWAQVASRSRRNATNTAAPGAESPYGFGDMRAGAATPGGRFGTLVLRSGVGIGRALEKTTKKPAASDQEVVDDWEEEIDKEEQQEREREQEQEQRQHGAVEVEPEDIKSREVSSTTGDAKTEDEEKQHDASSNPLAPHEVQPVVSAGGET